MMRERWLMMKEGRLARTFDKWDVLRDYGLIQKPRIFGRKTQSPRDNDGDMIFLGIFFRSLDEFNVDNIHDYNFRSSQDMVRWLCISILLAAVFLHPEKGKKGA